MKTEEAQDKEYEELSAKQKVLYLEYLTLDTDDLYTDDADEHERAMTHALTAPQDFSIRGFSEDDEAIEAAMLEMKKNNADFMNSPEAKEYDKMVRRTAKSKSPSPKPSKVMPTIAVKKDIINLDAKENVPDAPTEIVAVQQRVGKARPKR